MMHLHRGVYQRVTVWSIDTPWVSTKEKVKLQHQVNKTNSSQNCFSIRLIFSVELILMIGHRYFIHPTRTFFCIVYVTLLTFSIFLTK